MILVLLGTQNNSFHRLLEKIEDCIQKGVIQEEVIVQAGGTKFTSSKMKIFDLIAKKELEELIQKANLVITHGGVGSIILCLEMGKKVIAVARQKQYEEHVNDHQIQIIDNFNSEGYIKGISEVEELERALKEIENFTPKVFTSNTPKVLKVIEDFIEKESK